MDAQRFPSDRPTVAVIGSGVAGLTAAYLLQRRFDVTLYESDSRLGGHAHTHDVVLSNGHVAGLDTGFLVHNHRTYPNLIRLFDELGVATQASEMSMSVSCRGCGLEYAGARGLSGLFPTYSTALRPRYLQMLMQVKRFHRTAREVLADPNDDRTLGAFIADHHFGRYFAHHFLLPLVSCVWSCGFDGARNYPARYLFAFLDHHGMLSVTGSPQWRTVVGGSRSYVDRAAKELSGVLTSTPVRAVLREGDEVVVHDDGDQRERFAHVVLATHPDQALGLLAAPTAQESRLLGSFDYLSSHTLLHTDSSVLPRADRARASWNYTMADCDSDDRAVRVSYDLNRLQRIDDPVTTYLVTLNDLDGVDPSRILDEMDYAHPTYTPTSVAAQAELPALNDGRVAFAGAWQGWGFHEDGCASGVRAAQSLGVDW